MNLKKLNLKKYEFLNLKIIEDVIAYQKTTFPDRTTNYKKCERDLLYILDAFFTDTENKNSVETMRVAGMFWENDIRQVSTPAVEIAVHNYMLEAIFKHYSNHASSLSVAEQAHLTELNTFLSSVIQNGPDYKTKMLATVQRSQRCQRNWDLTKEIDLETVNWLMEIGYTAPTKHNLDTFEIVAVTDREKIHQFSNAAKTHKDHNSNQKLSPQIRKGDKVQNPQTDANVLFLFFLKPESRNTDERAFREKSLSPPINYWTECVNLEIGLAASAIAIAANQIGLRSGFCRCYDKSKMPMHLLSDYNLDVDSFVIFLGVGHPIVELSYYEHANGHKSKPLKKIPKPRIII
jgi:nitroreductase